MRHPIHALPFDTPIAHALHAEYAALPWPRRLQLLRKAAGRELSMLLGGQAGRRVRQLPAGTRSLLWIYSWSTVGDAIMELAPRTLLPASIELHLLIAPALAPLFAHDRRFAAVHSSVDSCPPDIGFVLLDAWRTASLKLKRQYFASQPFASMRGHHAGERFDRAAYADRRLRQLIGLPAGAVVAPSLALGGVAVTRRSDRVTIGVPLGARVAAKRYRHWNEVLGRLAERWPAALPPPRFRLLGTGASAHADLQTLDGAFVARHAEPLIDSGDLRKTALDLTACDAFLGVDGGLMHVAIGVGTPGLALFADVEPGYFVRPEASMRWLRSAGEVSAIAPATVVDAFLAGLADGFKPRGG